MATNPPVVGQFEARPASFASRLGHKAMNILTEGGDEIVPEETAPAWALRDVIYNRALSNSILLGTVVALAFCGTWCVPCQWEAPDFKKLHMDYAVKGLRIIGVFMDYPDDIRRFAISHDITNRYPVCVATPRILWDYQIYPAGRVPVFALVNRNGILVSTALGYHPRNHYEQQIVALL